MTQRKPMATHVLAFTLVSCLAASLAGAQPAANKLAVLTDDIPALLPHRVTDSGVPVSTLMADNYVPGLPGDVAAKLTPRGVLESITVAGRTYALAGTFPTFAILTANNTQTKVPAADPQWKTTIEGNTATYSAKGLAVRIDYKPDRDRLHIVATILSEGDWKLVSIGGNLLYHASPKGTGEYLLTGSGNVVYDDTAENAGYEWVGNGDNVIGAGTSAGFVSIRHKDRFVYVKPLTLSYLMAWNAGAGAAETQYSIDSTLLFRPDRTKNFATKLCHDSLAFRIETTGDQNDDKTVDWVDAGIAYRLRYLKPHPSDPLHHTLRDSFRVYYDIGNSQSFTQAISPLTRIDFAPGTWWLKRTIESTVDADGESHKYEIKRRAQLMDVQPVKDQATSAGQRLGIYYGHDYISDIGGWPEEFYKLDPDGKRYIYGTPRPPVVQKIYWDNVRTVASGAAFRFYDKMVQACVLRPEDPIQFDTYSAFARQGYHPQFPATPELETQAKRAIAKYLRDKYGVSVSGEGNVEGYQDVIDYGSYAVVTWQLRDGRFWEKKDGQQRVPLFPVIFQGAGYYGSGWYEFRRPSPNWAIALVNGVGFWDWMPEGPDMAWQRFARFYFNQNLPWSLTADARVKDITQKGSRFTVLYDNNITLEADYDAASWVLVKDGVRYDGFTPFNTRGYMAVLKQGPFEIELPGEHRLEVSPQQPMRDQIKFECIPADGKTILRGDVGQKWKFPLLQTIAGKDVTSQYDADPVLVLRKVR